MSYFLETCNHVFLFIVCLSVFLFASICCINLAEYHLDKTNVSVYVDNAKIYSGKSHFISVDFIGENGNTKKITVYEDILLLKPVKRYISDSVSVK